MTQFLEGGAGGPNGRDGRTVRSSEQDPTSGDPAADGPDALGGRGSLMSRYRGAGSPAGTEDEATPPQPRTGETPAASPWRDSGWTSAPPVPQAAPPAAPPVRPPAPPASSAPPAPPTPPAPPAPPASSAPAVTPASDKPAPPAPDRPAASSALDRPAGSAPALDKPSGSAPALDKPPAPAPAAALPGAVDKPSADRPGGKPADKPGAASGDRPVEPGPTSADPAPVVTVTRGVTPGSGTKTTPLLSAERTGEFKQRWRDLQGDFVDDPQQAVRGAGELAREVLQELSDTIADSERVEGWQAGDGSSGTEDLRVALRQYRTLVDRLLEL